MNNPNVLTLTDRVIDPWHRGIVYGIVASFILSLVDPALDDVARELAAFVLGLAHRASLRARG